MKAVVLGLIVLSICIPALAQTKPPTDDARAFVDKLNKDLKRLWVKSQTADWIRDNFITDDTEQNAAWANEEVLAYVNHAIKETNQFRELKLDPKPGRATHILRTSSQLPAPSDPAKRSELAEIASKLQGLYGKGKWCGPEGKDTCRDLEQLSEVMSHSHNYDELLDAWVGWRTISPSMRPLYQRLVELSNEGAKEIGFSDTGDLWRAGYDMSSNDFAKETDQLWGQVPPLYQDLHCYLRAHPVEDSR